MSAKRPLKLTDICANCGRTYGKHSAFWSQCPDPDWHIRRFSLSRFKLADALPEKEAK